MSAKKVVSYDENSIEVLEGLDAVRKRPGMYVGGTGIKALHHLIYEIVDNSVDEVLAGYCDTITIIIHADNSVSIEDNGRGIPYGNHPKYNKPALEILMTVLHSGGKFQQGGYTVAGGLHGVGLSVVNALSSWLVATVKRDGKEVSMRMENSITASPLKEVSKTKETGSKIHFMPDPEIFDTIIFDYDTLAHRFKEIAYLNKNLRVNLQDNREKKAKIDSFYFSGGISEYILDINTDKKVLHKQVAYVENKKDNINIEVAFQYTDEYTESIYSYVNNIPTIDGGTHEQGFKNALSKVANDVARKKNLLKEKDSNLSGEDIREGLVAILNLKMSEPQFESQVKSKLANANVKDIVESVVYDSIQAYFIKNLNVLSTLVTKAKTAAKAKEAARKIREVSNKKNTADVEGLSAKFAKCTSKNPNDCELYLVEGDSAGGSAKQARDRFFQAILPLRGKVLNTTKTKTLSKILSNEEIKTIITAIGAGIGKDFDITKSKYHKIVIMTDADVDGKHICVLLLTLFYNILRPLLEQGMIYIACPPLYEVTQGKNVYYAFSDKEKDQIIKKLGKSKFEIQRYKGLGEMDESELWETTMNPETRKLIRVTIEDAIRAEKVINMLMGDKIEERRDFIYRNAKYAHLD